MRRPRPSYKKLYEAVLKAMCDQQEGYQQYTDSTPTHIVTIYDTVEWIYHIKAKDDAAAENFGPMNDDVEIIGMEKKMYATNREVQAHGNH